MATAKPSKLIEQRKNQSPSYFYVCQHDASNNPCPKCHPDKDPVSDNWEEDYTPPRGPLDQVKM